jgi:hypothetical protein
VLATAVAGSASTSQAQTTPGGFYASAGGWWLGYTNLDSDSGPGLAHRRSSAPDGWGGQAFAGYQIDSSWDVRVGFTASRLSGRSDFGSASSFDTNERYLTPSLEAGYTWADSRGWFRPSLGVIYVDVRQSVDTPPSFGVNPRPVDFRGVGPRLGLEGAFYFSESPFFLYSRGSGAWFTGNRRGEDTLSLAQCGFLGGASPPCPTPTHSNSGWTFDAELAFGMRFASNWSAMVGVRGEAWLLDSSRLFAGGPFVRISYGLGTPARR